MPKQWRQHYLTYTATRSQWQFRLSKISQQTVMYMNTDITYGTLLVVRAVSHYSPLARPYTSSTAALLAFWRTCIVKDMLGHLLFCKKSTEHNLFFRNTRFFSFNYLRDFYCFSGMWVAGLVATRQDYAVTTISQCFKFWTYAVFADGDRIFTT
jgi:hypothetical protein